MGTLSADFGVLGPRGDGDIEWQHLIVLFSLAGNILIKVDHVTDYHYYPPENV